MPEKTPVRINYTNTTATGLAEYQSDEYISAKHGGTDNIGVATAEVLVGDVSQSNPKYLRKKITGTDNQITILTSTLSIILTSRPSTGGSNSNFITGEIIYQGSIASPTAKGVVITGTNNSTSFTIQYQSGEFVKGGELFAQNSEVESNSIRTATIVNETNVNSITEQQSVSFKLGTYSISAQDYVIDCGELTGLSE